MKQLWLSLMCSLAALSGAAQNQYPAKAGFDVRAGDSAYRAGSEFYGQRATLFDVLPVRSDHIVMLGNSITNGCEWHELLDNPKVINRGISGDVISGVDTRLASVLKGRPAKIFLLIGVNDVSHHVGADSVLRDYRALVGRIRSESPGTQLYIQSCLPVNQDFRRYKTLDNEEQTIRDINARLPQLAAEYGAVYIDVYGLLADSEGKLRRELTNDGLHLLGPAYLIWAEALKPYLGTAN